MEGYNSGRKAGCEKNVEHYYTQTFAGFTGMDYWNPEEKQLSGLESRSSSGCGPVLGLGVVPAY